MTTITLIRDYLRFESRNKKTCIDLAMDDNRRAMEKVYHHIQKNKDNEDSFLYLILKQRGNYANNIIWLDKNKITLCYNFKEFVFSTDELFPILDTYFYQDSLETTIIILYLMFISFIWIHLSLYKQQII